MERLRGLKKDWKDSEAERKIGNRLPADFVSSCEKECSIEGLEYRKSAV